MPSRPQHLVETILLFTFFATNEASNKKPIRQVFVVVNFDVKTCNLYKQHFTVVLNSIFTAVFTCYQLEAVGLLILFFC